MREHRLIQLLTNNDRGASGSDKKKVAEIGDSSRFVDAKSGSSNQFREDVLRLYELSEYIRMQESSLERLKNGPNGPITVVG